MIRPVAVLLLLSLAACGDRGQYPSLALRPIEQRSVDPAVEPDRPAAVIPPDPAIIAQIAKLQTDVATAKAEFDKDLALNGATARRGAEAPRGSEAWIVGQTALSTIERTHGMIQTAVAAIGDEQLAFAQKPVAVEEVTKLEALAAEADAIEKAQAAVIRPLVEALSRS